MPKTSKEQKTAPKSTFKKPAAKPVTKPVTKPATPARKPGQRGPDKKPRAKTKPRTSNTPKTPGAKVIVKKTDAIIPEEVQDIDEDAPFEPYPGLNIRQSLFVNYYIRSLNATRSAEKAGYEGDYNTIAQTGFQLLRLPKIAKLIKEHYQRNVMSKDEMTERLTKMARSSFSPFLKIEDDNLNGKTARMDLTSEEAQENHDLIREFSSKTIDKIASEGDGGEESALLVNEVRVKLHDPLRAMEILAKLYGNAPEDEKPAANNSLTLNGNVVVASDAAVSFLSKALGVAAEQIPVTADSDTGGSDGTAKEQ